MAVSVVTVPSFGVVQHTMSFRRQPEDSSFIEVAACRNIATISIIVIIRTTIYFLIVLMVLLLLTAQASSGLLLRNFNGITLLDTIKAGFPQRPSHFNMQSIEHPKISSKDRLLYIVFAEGRHVAQP